MPKRHIYYYFDERNDDFANTNIKTITTPKDYKYYSKNIFYRFFKSIIYFLIIIICKIAIIFMGIRVKNKKVLKDLKDKNKGYFIYGNHTSYFSDAVTGHLLSFPKQASVICNPDALSIKGIKHLVKMLGAYPVPTYKESYINFVKAMEKLINDGKTFIIYPEAHIWPHYSKIRDFSDFSFFYPIKFDVPSFAKTTVYNKTKNGKYKMTVYIDGPFYPDHSLPFNDAKKKLCSEIKDAMKKRVINNHSEQNPDYSYIKVNDPKDVRIEISNK